MRNLCKIVSGVWVIGIAMSGPALAFTSAVGPYYATPSWDQQLPAATRFIVLTNWGNAAVLDRETGLVWEQSPSVASGNTWYDQSYRCMNLNTGGRAGWRLPTVQELLSLVDRSAKRPSLPNGHPFGNVQLDDLYVSATTFWAGYPDYVRGVEFATGLAFNGGIQKTTQGVLAWCVRGGQGVDPQ